MFRFGLFDHPPTGNPKAVVTSPAHVELARKVAADGTVLLKNDGDLLPLDPHHIASIALIGKGAGKAARTGGGGSASVNPSALVTPLDGISGRAGATTKLLYDNGDNPATAAATARSADVAIVIASLAESEGTDLPNIDLPSGQNELISAVARANRRTVVVLNTGSAVTMPWVNSVAGILEAWYPGQADGAALAAVLFGDVNPSGKLPVTFPRSLAQVPASQPQSWPGLAGTSYSEGLNVGYRWYDANNITPLFPFGYGLSYTRFAFDHLAVTPAATSGGPVTISVDVTNTGGRNGSEVVQAYVGDPPAANEPPRQLKGLSKVALAPGQTKRVSVQLDSSSFSHWEPGRGQWVASPGEYKIWLGDSSRDLPLERGVTLTSEVISGTPPPPLPPTPPGQVSANLNAALSCAEDVAAPVINGVMSLPLFSLPGE
jgi:beta-glucosidase